VQIDNSVLEVLLENLRVADSSRVKVEWNFSSAAASTHSAKNVLNILFI
jgi:hypothetical protein